MDLLPGSYIRLPTQHDAPRTHTYQVIGVDPAGGRCWLRRWPLREAGCPVFEISLQDVKPCLACGSIGDRLAS